MIGITRDGDFYLYNGDVNNIRKQRGKSKRRTKNQTQNINKRFRR